MNYIDYFIIGFIAFYGFWGVSKGLLKIILDLAGYVAAFFAAKIFSPVLFDYVNTTGIYGNIQDKLYQAFNKVSPDLSKSVETLKLPDNMDVLLRQEPELSKVLDAYPKLNETLSSNMSSLSGRGLMDVITEYVVLILCAVAIFILAKIIISVIISVILSRQDQLPLAMTNRLLGLSLGVVISFALLSFIFQLGEVYSLTSSPVISDAIADSRYGHVFTSIPILDWISKII